MMKTEQKEAAQLIAAAPELLEACKAAEIVITEIECGHDKPLATGYALDLLRAAITKAQL